MHLACRPSESSQKNRKRGIILGMTAKPIAEPMRVVEVAVYTSMGVSMVRKLIKGGQLPASRIGRSYVIDRHDLDAYLEALKSPKPKK